MITYNYKDITGVQEFTYDSVGNIIQNRHSYVVPNSAQEFTFTTKWEYVPSCGICNPALCYYKDL